MSHYIKVHLENKPTGTVILHFGVNNVLNDNSQFNVDNLMSNFPKKIEKFKRVGVRNILVSGW